MPAIQAPDNVNMNINGTPNPIPSSNSSTNPPAPPSCPPSAPGPSTNANGVISQPQIINASIPPTDPVSAAYPAANFNETPMASFITPNPTQVFPYHPDNPAAVGNGIPFSSHMPSPNPMGQFNSNGP